MTEKIQQTKLTQMTEKIQQTKLTQITEKIQQTKLTQMTEKNTTNEKKLRGIFHNAGKVHYSWQCDITHNIDTIKHLSMASSRS